MRILHLSSISNEMTKPTYYKKPWAKHFNIVQIVVSQEDLYPIPETCSEPLPR